MDLLLDNKGKNAEEGKNYSFASVLDTMCGGKDRNRCIRVEGRRRYILDMQVQYVPTDLYSMIVSTI